MDKAEDRARFASQTYSWQMSKRWQGRLGEISAVVGQAGFAGIEPEVCMMGGFDSPETLDDLLQTNGLALAAITLVLDWRGTKETAEEREEADRVIDLVRRFDGARLALVQNPFDDGADRAQAQDRLVACLDSIARRATDHGVVATFHPNSPVASIVRTQSDYDRVLPRLPAGLGWTPDTGHLAAGGMDVVQMIRTYRDLVNHIHLKDADTTGRWVPTGQGAVDLVGSVRVLAETNYTGWIVMEDESPSAESDPNAAGLRNARWAQENLEPLFSASQHAEEGDAAARTDEQRKGN